MSGPIFIKVDWSRNGVFTDALDDVTDRVRGPVNASVGRDQVTALSPVIAGRGDFRLDNHTKAYSPRNAASPLFGNLKPRRPVLITRVVGATTYTIFYGHTDDAPIDPDVDSKMVGVNLVDGLADFRGINITTQLYQGIRTGDAIGHVLDAAGWTGARDIDTGSTLIPWFWTAGEDAFSVLQDLLASEGQPALMSIDTTGAFVFRDRHHRLVRSASTTSQVTMRGTGTVEPCMGVGFTYSDNWQNIVNSVALTFNERGILGSRAEPVFTSDEVITIAALASLTILIQTTDPFRDAQPLLEDRDYTVIAGAITAVTISSTSGAVTSLTFTAGAAGATITNVQLRAWAVTVTRSYQIVATDSTSITDYGQRSNPSGTDPVWASRSDAQAIADLFILQRKQPLPILSVRFSCQTTQTARLNKVLSLDLSDRATVVETETAVNSDFFVENISHAITSAYDHEVTFGLEAVPSTPTSAFILNSSTLNSAAPLGY